MRILLLIIFFLLTPSTLAFPIVSEIMYNPASSQGNDTALEWIELQSMDEVNLSMYLLDGKKLNGSFSGYVVIARNREKFLAHYGLLNCSVLQLTISLANEGDVVNLSNGSFEDVVVYLPALGANGNGRTLERNASRGFLESLVVGGTPCQNNSVQQPALSPPVRQPALLPVPAVQPLAPLNNAGGNVLEMVLGAQILGLMPNPEGNDDAEMPGGEWVEVYNGGDAAVDLQGLTLQDAGGHILKMSANNTASLLLQPSTSTKVYRNGDTRFSLNNDADTILLVDGNGNVLDTASYTGSKEGLALRKMNAGWVSEEKPAAASSKSGTSTSSGKSKKKANVAPLLIGEDTSAQKATGKIPRTAPSSSTLQFAIKGIPSGEVVYVSPRAATSNAGLYFFALSVVLLVIVLVFKKDF